MEPMPSAIYVWLVRSEEVLDQPGSWRIRKWDIAPFPEANFAVPSETAAPTGDPHPCDISRAARDDKKDDDATPRTDAAEYAGRVMASFARQLERELAEEKLGPRVTLQEIAAALGAQSAELPPIPTKRTNEDRSDWYGSGYVDGWNACVDRLRNATDSCISKSTTEKS